MLKSMIKGIAPILFISVASFAHAKSSHCENMQLTFYNSLSKTVKVIDASVVGAVVEPVEFLSMAPHSQQTFSLKNVTADDIAAHYNFEVQGEGKVNVNVDFKLSDAFLRCSHSNNTMKHQNGVTATSSRGYGSVSYTLK